jgi:transcriptional regulator with XRE-family HTH domain
MRFGDYLRQKREERGWTQPEAAARAKIEQSYLSKLETGRSYPSDEVFERLVEIFGIDTAELNESVSATELDRLREIRQVRAAVLGNRASQRRLARSWMLAGLACLILGGGTLGLSRIDLSREYTLYYYRSEGVLNLDEGPNTFDSIRATNNPGHPRYEEGLAMLARIAQRDVVAEQYRGSGYFEEVEGGRRYYDLYESERLSPANPLRWFLVPGLMLLLGSAGCFFISFRWK